MGLEIRNGRVYYYSKRRVGGKVVSVYEAAGDVARLYALTAEEERDAAEEEKARIQASRAELEELDRLVGETLTRAKDALTALYVVNGYHEHSRSWRKRRT